MAKKDVAYVAYTLDGMDQNVLVAVLCYMLDRDTQEQKRSTI